MRLTGQVGRLALAGVLIGCGGGGDAPPAPPKVATVTVTSTATQVEVGATIQLLAAAKDSKGGAMNASFTWSSSASTVASVDGTGVVTGVAAGSASITATADGVSGSASITVIPVPVAAVLIAQRTPAVRQGETVQLSAVAQDAIARPLAGRVITWSSANPSIATVTNAGVVTGVSSGSAFIRATSEGKSDSVSLRVKSLNAPTIATTTPAQWAPGTTATITGTNYSAVPSENEVVINGVSIPVTSSTTTAVTFTVPAATALPCSPTGPVPVGVVVNGDTALSTANLRVATQRTLAVGQHLLLTSSADVMCNEFAATGGKYLVTAFNASTSSASRVNFQLLGASTSGASLEAATAAVSARAQPGPTRAALQTLDGERFARGHLAVLQDNERFGLRQGVIRGALQARRARARAGADLGTVARSVSPATAALQAPPVAPPNVGDKQWIRMRRDFASATVFDSVRVRVVYVGPKLIIVEDTTNEMAGSMDTEFQNVGTEFDRDMWGFLSSFGDPLVVDSLTDNNARVVAVFSKRVNEYTLSGGGALLGFVTLCDFFPRTDPNPNNACPTSNEGEYFYAIVPNPNGVRGKYSLDLWKRYARGTMIHELKHVVMFAQRIYLDADFTEETWLEEATAQMATELWARKIYGSFAPRSDIGWSQGPRCDYASASASCGDPVEAIMHPFGFLYQHYNANESKTFLANSDVVIYGSAWSFARWVTDQYDAGNEGNFLRSLVQQQSDRGVTNILNRTGRPWPELVGLFSMASTADNYPAGTITDARLRLPSWNTRDVFSGMNANLVFRNQDGSTTPAFPRVWPMNVRATTFGTFSDVLRTVTNLPGSSWAAWELSGTQTAPQVLALRALNGTLAPSGLGMVVLRVQ
ncbi:MAG: Ig-like domain-containing protein [Gemmatimonadetes bacterium]|nr:Ig-like domain-containing protein [Gemmatimonadota bacterium]